MSDRLFLTAEWRYLGMANYIVEPGMLQEYVPAGTEIDLWEGKCFVSLVGFMFLNTRVLGWQIPWHVNFEEVNLRFYVRRKMPDGTARRGVVFIREIVPKAAISWVANTIYGENYATRPMAHKWEHEGAEHITEYAWVSGAIKKERLRMTFRHEPRPNVLVEGSNAAFITEHYWGYARLTATKTMEYEVRHPAWNIFKVLDFELMGDLKQEYGPLWDEVFQQKPFSVFLAEGSEVSILKGNKFG